MEDIKDILSKTTKTMEEAMAAAYQRGFEAGSRAGQQKAASIIKTRLTDLMKFATDAQAGDEYANRNDLLTISDDAFKGSDSEQRAAPGTVKPVVLATVANSINGVSTKDVERATGVKYNSVRGTLWQLQKEGAITRNEDGRWIPTSPVKEAAKQQSLETYLEEIRKAEAENSEAPTGKPEGASETTPGGAGTPGTGDN